MRDLIVFSSLYNLYITRVFRLFHYIFIKRSFARILEILIVEFEFELNNSEDEFSSIFSVIKNIVYYAIFSIFHKYVKINIFLIL